jgi:hypothetical protein
MSEKKAKKFRKISRKVAGEIYVQKFDDSIKKTFDNLKQEKFALEKKMKKNRILTWVLTTSNVLTLAGLVMLLALYE